MDSTKLVKVTHLKVVTICQTEISIQKMIEILEASLTATKLIEICWGHLDLWVDILDDLQLMEHRRNGKSWKTYVKNKSGDL